MNIDNPRSIELFLKRMDLIRIGDYTFSSPLSGGGSNITAIYENWEKKAVAKFFFIGPHPSANKKFENELNSHRRSRELTDVLPELYSEFSSTDGFIRGYLMEYISGPSLESMLIEGSPLATDEALMTIYRVGWAYHHTLTGIIHGDLHPGNIIFESPLNDWLERRPESPEVRIIDLGASISPYHFSYTESFDEDLWNDFRKRYSGSFYSLAPEFFSVDYHKKLIYGGGKFDCWSLGLILYRMLTGTLLNVADSLGEYVELIYRGNLQAKITNQLATQHFEKHLEILLSKMLQVDSTDRIELTTAIGYAHQLYNKNPELIDKHGHDLEKYIRYGCCQNSYLGLPPHEWDNSVY